MTPKSIIRGLKLLLLILALLPFVLFGILFLIWRWESYSNKHRFYTNLSSQEFTQSVFYQGFIPTVFGPLKPVGYSIDSGDIFGCYSVVFAITDEVATRIQHQGMAFFSSKEATMLRRSDTSRNESKIVLNLWKETPVTMDANSIGLNNDTSQQWSPSINEAVRKRGSYYTNVAGHSQMLIVIPQQRLVTNFYCH